MTESDKNVKIVRKMYIYMISYNIKIGGAKMINLESLFSQEKSLKVKVLVAMLIMTLTFANIFLLGMYTGTGSVTYRNRC